MLLKLDISKVTSILGWKPTWNLSLALEKIVNWHKCWIEGDDMRTKCINEIDEFTKDMKYGD
jgi:CDP-glucose 4,6-dehydratase